MVEYGQGVGQVAGQAGGSAGSGQMDLGAQVASFVNDTVTNVSSLPPAYLLIGAVIIVIGLIILRRAF